MFTMRFDMRSGPGGASAAQLYTAAVEMCGWAESRGAVTVILSEHHAAEDGHLPSPLILASGIAATTTSLPILLAALVLPLYDPVRLAEDIAVLDNIGGGRLSYVLGIGHRDVEYHHFGVDPRRRGRIADANLDLLLRLLDGEPILHERRRIHVTPAPLPDIRRRIMVAGGGEAAADRAARHGLGFVAQADPPGLREFFADRSRAYGHEPGPTIFPSGAGPTAAFVADDVDRAWDELGPFLLHDARMAASYRPGDDSVASITRAQTVAELRAAVGAYRVFSPTEAAELLRAGNVLALHPLCGGLPPEVAWRYLETAARVVAAR